MFTQAQYDRAMGLADASSGKQPAQKPSSAPSGGSSVIVPDIDSGSNVPDDSPSVVLPDIDSGTTLPDIDSGTILPDDEC